MLGSAAILLDPVVWAAIGAIFGNAGLKFIEHFLLKSRHRVDDAKNIRDEMRMDIIAQREEIRQLEQQVDGWRERYFTLKEDYLEAKAELTMALQHLRTEIESEQDEQ